jgi:multicomponent Na+:H+ antiporter subunit G
MDLAIAIASWACLLLGSFFCMVGGLGIIRLPDFYTRLHGAGITDTLGAGLVLLGLVLQAGLSLLAVKLAMIFFLLLLTSPTSTHAIARAARASGQEPVLDEP